MATTGRAPRPTTSPEALSAAYRYPALEAIFRRRSRRFPLGGSLTGPLAYTSTKDPVPLSYEEEAILVAAATGATGLALEEWPFLDADGKSTSGDKLGTFTGRAYPSPLANHNVELFWTNDDGVFCLPQRDVRATGHDLLRDPDAASALYRNAVKLQDGRLDIPRDFPNLFAFNHQIPNVPGSTLFMPVSDITRQAITAMLLYFDQPHGVYIYDPQAGGDPLAKWVKSGWLRGEHPVELQLFEKWQMVDANGTEQGLIIQNLMLATQALGLGGHPFSGGKGRVTMGGERFWHAIGGTGPAGSLGFTFHRVPKTKPYEGGQEIPVGLPGIFEGAVPPFHRNMSDAVDFVVNLRWGPGGIFSDETRAAPWASPEVRRAVPRPSDTAIEITKTMVSYIWKTYGRFPATIDPMLMTIWYQAHHLDIDFYDAHYPADAVPEHIRNHMCDWHGQKPAKGKKGAKGKGGKAKGKAAKKR